MQTRDIPEAAVRPWPLNLRATKSITSGCTRWAGARILNTDLHTTGYIFFVRVKGSVR